MLPNWFTQLPPPTQAAILTGAVTLAGIIVKDIAIATFQNHAKDKNERLEIYRKYAEPLAAAATSLLWRLKEVLDGDGRGTFLRSDAPPNVYITYKRISTAFRVGSLIAWTRALRREQAYLRSAKRKSFQEIEDAFSKLERALADGPHAELDRLTRFAKLWHLALPEEDHRQTRIAVLLEDTIDREKHSIGFQSFNSLIPDDKLRLSSAAVRVICAELFAQPIAAAVLAETKDRACAILDTREAWIYRDWQVAIGDLLLRESKNEFRSFEVIGYGQFEQMFLSGSEEERRWINRLMAMLDDLDVSLLQSSDHRVGQLRSLYRATAGLIVALGRAQTKYELFSAATQNLAEKVCGNALDSPRRVWLPKVVTDRLPKVVTDRLPKVVTDRLPKVVTDRLPVSTGVEMKSTK